MCALLLDLHVQSEEAGPGPDDLRVREADAQQIPDLVGGLPGRVAADVAHHAHPVENCRIEHHRHCAGVERLPAEGPGIGAVRVVENAGEDAGPRPVAPQDLIRLHPADGEQKLRNFMEILFLREKEEPGLERASSQVESTGALLEHVGARELESAFHQGLLHACRVQNKFSGLFRND